MSMKVCNQKQTKIQLQMLFNARLIERILTNFLNRKQMSLTLIKYVASLKAKLIWLSLKNYHMKSSKAHSSSKGQSSND
jgi:hypothetical protein